MNDKQIRKGVNRREMLWPWVAKSLRIEWLKGEQD